MTYAPGKREVKEFEPPPWEREAFEQLARERRQAEEQSQRQEQQEQEQEPNEQPGEVLAEAAMQAFRAEAVAVDTDEASPEPAAPASGPAVEVMLSALRAEEPDVTAAAGKLGIVAAVFVVAIGTMLIVWGAVALARTLEAGPVGWLGSGIMVFMGIGLVSLGIWLGGRSLRKQGVL